MHLFILCKQDLKSGIMSRILSEKIRNIIPMINIIREPSSKLQIKEMLQSLGTYIKLAVDVERKILAGGGTLHADCEAVLLEDGSQQEFIWGADWNPASQQVTFEALINIRPNQNNRSMDILDPDIRDQVEKITRYLLGES